MGLLGVDSGMATIYTFWPRTLRVIFHTVAAQTPPLKGKPENRTPEIASTERRSGPLTARTDLESTGD